MGLDEGASGLWVLLRDWPFTTLVEPGGVRLPVKAPGREYEVVAFLPRQPRRRGSLHDRRPGEPPSAGPRDRSGYGATWTLGTRLGGDVDRPPGASAGRIEPSFGPEGVEIIDSPPGRLLWAGICTTAAYWMTRYRHLR